MTKVITDPWAKALRFQVSGRLAKAGGNDSKQLQRLKTKLTNTVWRLWCILAPLPIRHFRADQYRQRWGVIVSSHPRNARTSWCICTQRLFFSEVTTLLRYLLTCILCLLVTQTVHLQSKPIFRLKAKLDFADTVKAHKLVDKENKLQLVGRKTLQSWDIATGNFSEPISLGDLEIEDRSSAISPDGEKLLVFGAKGVRSTSDKAKHSAIVLDLRTGKQLAVLDKVSKPIRAAFWSSNGKTLVTSSDRAAPYALSGNVVEIAFWDGETFNYRNALPSDKVNWFHLTTDGSKCFYTIGQRRHLLLIIKSIGEAGGPLNIWDTNSGRSEPAVTLGDAYLDNQIEGIWVGPDERLLTFIVPGSKLMDSESKLVVWGIKNVGNSTFEMKPKYEINPTPDITDIDYYFSSDGTYLAVNGKEYLRIYDAQTGTEKFALERVGALSRQLINDGKLLLVDYGWRLEAMDTVTGNTIYKHDLIYSEIQVDDNLTPILKDRTTIRVNPHRDLLLTYSKQFAEVLDARTGKVLQTLVSPPIDYSKKKPKPSGKPLVSDADWSSDGRSVYIISADGASVTLWESTD
ncbi:MAG: hypothetical protein QOH96_3309 [Blastocatellia bacterium]|nr:hypothetical protein [Blastocatellia bacterium]